MSRSCNDYPDEPGVNGYPQPPALIPWNNFTEPWHLQYQLTIEVSCQGNIGSQLSDSVSLYEQYDFNLTYRPDGTVIFSPRKQ